MDIDSYTFDKKAHYFHVCPNESVDGIELKQSTLKKILEKAKTEMPHQIVTCDMSSSIGTRSLAKDNLWQEFGVVYSGSQNSRTDSMGLTFVMVREDILDRVEECAKRSPVPQAMEWSRKAGSLHYQANAPSMLSIYSSQLMCEYMI